MLIGEGGGGGTSYVLFCIFWFYGNLCGGFGNDVGGGHNKSVFYSLFVIIFLWMIVK